MRTSELEKKKLVVEWRLIADHWEKQAKGIVPLLPDSTGEKKVRTKEERAAMADCLRDSANELEAMLG